MSTIDALPPLASTFTNVTWDAPRFGPPDGYIHLPEGASPDQVAEVRHAWRAYADNPAKGPLVLIGGAKFVPWSAYEPQAVLSEAIEIDADNGALKWLAIAIAGNAIAIVAIAVSLILQ